MRPGSARASRRLANSWLKKEHRVQVDVEDPHPALARDLLGAHRIVHARVVDEDVDRTDRLLAAVEDRRDRIELGEVRGHHGYARAVAREIGADLFEPFRAARDQHEVGAGDREGLGEFDAETA